MPLLVIQKVKIVITFTLGHLKFFRGNGPKSCCDQPKSLILNQGKPLKSFLVQFEICSKKNRRWPNLKTILSSLLSFILNRECTVIVKTFNLSKSYFLMFLSSLKIAGVHLADFWRKCLAVNVIIFCASIPRKTFLTVAYHNRIYDMSTSAGWNPLRSKNEKWLPFDLFVSSLLFWSFFS